MWNGLIMNRRNLFETRCEWFLKNLDLSWKVVIFISKMYSVISMKLKSRPKEYADTVFGKILRHDMERIQRKLHQIGTYDIIKIYHVLMIKVILFSVER